jgi:O-acetyl-ADP-ribose deacetylase (regulator of RNase III)
MLDHMVKNGVKEVCMPRIGCGLDGLQWKKVKSMLKEVFCGTDMSITVYYL